MTISAEVVRQLSSGRWLIPLLAAMAAEKGSRFSALARRLQVSRSILSRSLDRLEELGWIRRNLDHGHPLRPEYFLTDSGIQLGDWCGRVMEQRCRLGLEKAALGRWSLPLLFELADDWKRFSALEQALAPITPRSLSLGLHHIITTRLAERAQDQPLYGLSSRGLIFIAPLVAAH